MKNRNKLFGFIAIAIIALAFIACGGNDSDPPPETFTVTFHANGGTPEPQPQTIEKGKTATEPQGVTKANNALVGWFKETALTTQWNFTADTVTTNIDLYAKWNEQPHDQSAVITGLFDNNASATVQGYLTDTEWNGVADTIKTALNSRFNTVSDAQKDTFRSVYTSREVKIVIEKNPEYPNYKTTFEGDTFYLNFATLNDDNFGLVLSRTNQVMFGNPGTPTEGIYPDIQHDSFNGVEVWSVYPVTDDEVATVIGYLTELYGYFVPTQQAKFATLTEIRIQTGDGVSKSGNVLTIGADETVVNIAQYIFGEVVAQVQMDKAIKLV